MKWRKELLVYDPTSRANLVKIIIMFKALWRIWCNLSGHSVLRPISLQSWLICFSLANLELIFVSFQRNHRLNEVQPGNLSPLKSWIPLMPDMLSIHRGHPAHLVEDISRERSGGNDEESEHYDEQSVIVQLSARVQDGTRCRSGSLDMCIQGKCQVRST